MSAATSRPRSRVDWELAGAIASAAAGGGGQLPDRQRLEGVVAEASGAVRSYTGLRPSGRLPEPEWVSRREWAAANIASVRDSVAVFERRLPSGPGLPGPLGEIASGTVAKLLAVQIGAFVGYASRRVLGQYEFALLGPEREPRLLFVAANVAEAQRSLEGDELAVLRWIALHEVTHAVQFGSAGWLGEHLRELARMLIDESELGVDVGAVAGSLKDLVGKSPAALLEQMRESDPMTLLTPPSSRRLIARTQATMAAIEGYAEHVMDAAAPALGEDVSGLRASMERRRDARRSPLGWLLSWLFGMELKMRQYRDGKRFADAVVAAEGIEALNRAWRESGSLPSLEELADSDAWLRRTAT